MALIPCPECNRQVSEMAPQCPGCGYPVATAVGTQKPKPSGGNGSPIATAPDERPSESSGSVHKTFGGWGPFIACSLVLVGIIVLVIKVLMESQ
jgi:hypothetical protein